MLKKLVLFVVLVTLTPLHILAAASSVIQEREVGGYRFTMIGGEHSLIWKIAHEGRTSTIYQNKENKEDLDQFYSSMSEAATHRFTLIASTGYFFIVCITTLIFYIKRKHIPLSVGMIIVCLAFGALYFSVTSFLEMQDAIRDVGYYYLRLVGE
ncbi:hypothetical protein CN378_17580 [Bacillus sp. AFS015802]|uniref:hypothetical protein n=1 Tax=Bacillus sp. AFS015802 TaxID=2033486 RepID=UPI000BF59EFC|nr:hypothetical protein [Bacillus sp. AFS015802]PFA62852.1 hypothetical protein CN378_17580 [Bacillus sp. AFS015802]